MKMNVLSLFDGMSCGQIALNRAGIRYDRYFASEIDKWAIQITQKNYPNTIQLGDVTKIVASDLPKIDLIMGGSPCQGFSLAGKGLNFEDPRSRLFFEFVRLVRELRPTYFLLENVKMKREWRDIISNELGCEPILFNSSSVSAQNRERLYWTNIPNIDLIDMNSTILADITEDADSIKNLPYYIADYDLSESLCSFFDGKELHNGGDIRFLRIGKHTSKNGLICVGGLLKSTNKLWLENGKLLQRNFSQGNRVYSDDGKSVTLNAHSGGIGGKTGLYLIDGKIRKLTPIECERLQTVPDNYTLGVSEFQRYTMLGNGWTVDVIAHIFKGIGE